MVVGRVVALADRINGMAVNAALIGPCQQINPSAQFAPPKISLREVGANVDKIFDCGKERGLSRIIWANKHSERAQWDRNVSQAAKIVSLHFPNHLRIPGVSISPSNSTTRKWSGRMLNRRPVPADEGFQGV